MTNNKITFLINASNLKAGGGLQVADSISNQLCQFPQHKFIVVLSSFLSQTQERLEDFKNVVVYSYDIKNTFNTVVLGHDYFLDSLVSDYQVDAVLTVFGPSRWKPRVPHLSGFALSQLIIPESPFFKRMGLFESMKWILWCEIHKWSLKRSADYFWTENSYISKRLKRLFNIGEVYTVTNYYNQVFDQSDKWKRTHKLPKYDGVTCLSVSSPSSHKNFPITVNIIRVMRQKYPDFKVRFVLTFNSDSLQIPDDMQEYFVFVGKVDVSECPYLYEQADIMFMPTLLECFTATYPEAMRMDKPIVTTDLEFARGLCGDAACYYSATDAEAAAEAIYRVATDKEYASRLVENGKKQLLTYDNYEQRADKLIRILEKIAKK